MRLRRLDLTRYGKFTDFTLDFGEVAAGEPDFHLIYGPNEAGKSTLLAGFLDLLFRIEKQSQYNFRHPYPTMRVGGTLEFPGNTVDLARIKRDQNDLLDAGGQPVPELVIAGQLGGIDRRKYRAMFSLDDDTLEEGGESILASKGDLGELLFSASAGLADLSETLGKLKEEAIGFTRPHGRNTQLLAFKDQLETLQRQRDAIDTAAASYAQVRETRDRTRKLYDEAVAERAALRARMDEIGRLLGALPRLAALRRLRERLVPLADLPAAPAAWFDELPTLRGSEIELGERARAVADEIARHQVDLDGIVVDEAALAVAERVDGWEAGRARAMTAEADIPRRLEEAADEERTIVGLLARIGQDKEADPRRFLLPAAIVGTLRALIERRFGIEQSVEQAAVELADSRRKWDAAVARLGEEGGAGAALRDDGGTGLAAALAAVRSSDHGARRRLADKDRAACLDELADRLPLLRPWSGDVEALVALAVPGKSDIAAWKTALATAQRAQGVKADALESLSVTLRQKLAERAALAASTGLVNERDADALREARAAAWAAHRRTLDADSADRFEAAMQRDDRAMDAMLRHERERERLRGLDGDIARARTDATLAQEAADRAAAAVREIEAAIAAAPPGGKNLPQLEEWLAWRENVLDVRTRLRRAERDVSLADADSASARQRLAGALALAGVVHDQDAGFDSLLALAQTVLDREQALKTLREAVAERYIEMGAREAVLDKARQADADWQSAWASACAGCWLRETRPALPAVREILTAVDALERALERRDGLHQRVAAMRDDQALFASEVGAVAQAWGWTFAPDAALATAATIARRVAEARQARDQRAALQRSIAGARQRQSEVAAGGAALAIRRNELTAFFGVTSLAEVDLALQGVKERANVTEQERAAEREILDMLGVGSLAAAEAVLDQADRDGLAAERAELTARFEDQDKRVSELFAGHKKAADALDLVGGDDAVARLDAQRRLVVLEIEEGASRYLKLRLGVEAAEQALRAYRQAHRSSMLARASEAFRVISRDAYRGLQAEPHGHTELLLAVAADGSTKAAAALSKGTRFQLYLALRVAGYHEYARHRPPVPFIADDIMETFDDFRAEEALGLFADMSKVGQVIYLTHHAHLCDLARRVSPSVRVHAL